MVKWISYGCLFLLLACVKDKPNPVSNELPNVNRHGVFVLNEGIYGNNNAELSFIDFTDKKVYQNINHSVNGTSLGDVAQDILLLNDKLFITINNSHKLVVLNSKTFALIAEIKNIEFPREVVQVNDSLLAVSSLYTKKIYFINFHSYQLVKTMEIDFPNTEHMLVHNGFLYVTNWNETSSLLYKINIQTLALDNKLNMHGKATHDIVIDKQENIWVLSGNKYKGVQSYLQMFNTNNGNARVFMFPAEEEPLNMLCDPMGNNVYFLKINYSGGAEHNGVYRMSIHDNVLPSAALIPANAGSYFYALGIDPATNNILVSDPKGFNQRSTVYEYSTTGHLLNEYQTGLGSNQFLFQ